VDLRAAGPLPGRGEAAFEPRSRRPKASPAAVSQDTVALIIKLRKELAGQGLDAGPHTICWHLEHRHQIRVSAATISRYLARAGLVVPEPRKRPRSAADVPHRVDHPGRDGQGLTGVERPGRLAFDLILQRSLKDVDDLFAGMSVLDQRRFRADIHTRLDHLAPRDAEILLLQIGTP
jgi:hypothetical protein